MNVGQLRQILKNIPDGYWVRTTMNEEDLESMENVNSVSIIENHNTIVLLQGCE